MKTTKCILILITFVFFTNSLSALPLEVPRKQRRRSSWNKCFVICAAGVITGIAGYLFVYFIRNKDDENKIDSSESVNLGENTIIQNKKSISDDEKTKETETEKNKSVINEELKAFNENLIIFTKKLEEITDQEEKMKKQFADSIRQRLSSADNINDSRVDLSSEFVTIFVPNSTKNTPTLNKDSNQNVLQEDVNRPSVDPIKKSNSNTKKDDGLMAVGAKIASESFLEASGELLKNIISDDNPRGYSMGIPDSEIVSSQKKPLFAPKNQIMNPNYLNKIFGNGYRRRPCQPAMIVSNDIFYR